MDMMGIFRVVFAATVVLIRSSSVDGLPLVQFYPFGVAIDRSLSPNDDTSSVPIHLNTTFPYFDEDVNTVYVNNNGALSFGQVVSTYKPDLFGELKIKMIAPYWADVDTIGTGTVWYRQSAEPALLARATDEIQTAFIGQEKFSPSLLFVATWDHVGYYAQKTDKTNTFQCVMATDGVSSFVIFLFADGEIQWTTGDDQSGGTDGLGGTPAIVGFSAGDGIRYTKVPGSRTDAIINITQTSNVAVPGVWIYRVDGEGIVSGGCSMEESVRLTVAPRSGTVLGGTAVQIAGLCFKETDTIICMFDGQETEGIYVSALVAVCVSPPLTSLGKVPLHLTVRSVSGTSVQGVGEFFSLPFNEGSRVRYPSINAIFNPGNSIVLTWLPQSVAPPLETNTVDVELYCLEDEGGTWTKISTLAEGISNNGSAVVTFLDLDRLACSVSIKIVASTASAVRSLSVSNATTLTLISKLLRLQPGVWTPIGIYYNPSNTSFLCSNWSSVQSQSLARDLQGNVEPCPPTVAQALADSRFDIQSEISGSVYSDAASCFNQVVLNSENGACLPGSRCCYDNDGSLLLGPPGGGTIDFASPQGPLRCYLEHIINDALPASYCCTGPTPACSTYYNHRPSQNEDGYVFHTNAITFGDPHFISLDGTAFTFNGRGEFILIDTLDASFTLQGRMVDAEDVNGSSVLATVVSAIAAKQKDSDIVQFEVSRLGIRARVNGQTLDFDEDVREQNLRNVALKDKGNNTLLARFSSGAFVEAKVDNEIMSVLSVRLPKSFQQVTIGLLGNFNGDPTDDLLPRGGSVPLAAQSTLESIHRQFGITWIIEDAASSLFTYKAGENFSDFYVPDYQPAFETTFLDPVLETRAEELCGGNAFCLYDFAVTGRMDIALSTLTTVQDYEYQAELTMLTLNCSHNPCENGGTCRFHAGSYLCTCALGFVGRLCENTEDQDSKDTINVAGIVAGTILGVVFVAVTTVTVSLLCWWLLKRLHWNDYELKPGDVELTNQKETTP